MNKYLYGFNPSGGAHRYTTETAVFEFFELGSLSWVELDFEHYRGLIDWRNLADMQTEVRELECGQWCVPECGHAGIPV